MGACPVCERVLHVGCRYMCTVLSLKVWIPVENASTIPVLWVRIDHYKSGWHTYCDRVWVRPVSPITIRQSILCLALSATRGDHTLHREYSFGPSAASLHLGIYTSPGSLIHIHICLFPIWLPLPVTTCFFKHRHSYTFRCISLLTLTTAVRPYNTCLYLPQEMQTFFWSKGHARHKMIVLCVEAHFCISRHPWLECCLKTNRVYGVRACEPYSS